MSVTFHDILSVYYKEIKKSYNMSDQYTIEIKKNPNGQVLNVYTQEKKILSSRYELLGIYDESTNLFVWGSSLTPSDKNNTLKVKNIKDYSTKLKSLIITKKFSDIDFQERSLYYLSENIFYITNENIQDFILLCIFVSKKLVLIKRNLGTHLISFYLITDVLQY